MTTVNNVNPTNYNQKIIVKQKRDFAEEEWKQKRGVASTLGVAAGIGVFTYRFVDKFKKSHDIESFKTHLLDRELLHANPSKETVEVLRKRFRKWYVIKSPLKLLGWALLCTATSGAIAGLIFPKPKKENEPVYEILIKDAKQKNPNIKL